MPQLRSARTRVLALFLLVRRRRLRRSPRSLLRMPQTQNRSINSSLLKRCESLRSMAPWIQTFSTLASGQSSSRRDDRTKNRPRKIGVGIYPSRVQWWSVNCRPRAGLAIHPSMRSTPHKEKSHETRISYLYKRRRIGY
jgi:hypothetical protein